MSSVPPTQDHLPAALGRGSIVGRYVVLSLVGRGGMGEVYAAYDPELDRRVAVKLLRVKAGGGVTLTEGRQRTLREAQAIARLSHPNVVVVYDVGTFEEKVFIAMEFVEGNTVTYWLQAQPRKWQEVVKVFTAAGRGLAAAHDKGLVHRDFKPDNVMVGSEGDVRVMDFGLARQIDERAGSERAIRADPRGAVEVVIPTDDFRVAGSSTIVLSPPQNEPSEALSTSTSGAFDQRLTRTGAMMGTPAYMAPEQFLGRATDARSDQFSFCIALYEALYGERPFAGKNMSELTANVVQANVCDAPAGTRVPVWLRKILLRGLQRKAADRFPSMADLLNALGHNPSTARRKMAIAGALALLPFALAFGVRQSIVDRRAVCGGAAEKLAGVWELSEPGEPVSARQDQIHRAFLNTGKSYAADVFATVSHSLTGYTRRWADMYRESCEATELRHEQSADVLDLRTSCLQERLGALRALTDVFGDANGEVVENAVSAANALPLLDRCADVPVLRAIVRPPEDPTTRTRAADLRRRLFDVKARFDAGGWKQALQSAPDLVREARAVGYQPLLAWSLSVTGYMYVKSNNAKEAERSLSESFFIADAAHDDEIRAESSTLLVYVVGFQERRFQDGHQWGTIAEAVLNRIGGHELLRAWLLNDLACVFDTEGQVANAVSSLKEALALKEKVLGSNHPDVGLSEINLAAVLKELGRNEEALAHNDRAIKLEVDGLGADHPDVALAFNNGGEILNALGRYDDARHSFERARVIWERELGPDHRNVADALTGVGLSCLAEGKPTEALVSLERALQIRETQEPDMSRRAETQFALAKALWDSNRGRARSHTLAEAARRDCAKSSAKAKALEIEGWLRAHRAS